MIIDGMGWNEKAIAGMTERQFVFQHGGCRPDLSKDERDAYLKDIYARIVPQTAENAAVVEPENKPAKKVKKG